MEAFRKVVNPCSCDIAGQSSAPAFAKIIYDGRNLSISGVIGPMRHGNCRGSAGQCVEEIRQGKPTYDWSRAQLDQFCNIWTRCHLNDLRPYCVHQLALGWPKQAAEKVTLYRLRLKDDARRKKRAAEKAAIQALQKGMTFTPTHEQIFYATLPECLETDVAPEELVLASYEPRKPLYPGDAGPTEISTRGQLSYEKSAQGILCKPCPICGYRYGTKWLWEAVPQEVLLWLSALPDSRVHPIWV